MKQVARNLTDSGDGFLIGNRFLIIDRDSKYYHGFIDIIKDAGTKPVRCPGDLNPHSSAGRRPSSGSILAGLAGQPLRDQIPALERTKKNARTHA